MKKKNVGIIVLILSSCLFITSCGKSDMTTQEETYIDYEENFFDAKYEDELETDSEEDDIILEKYPINDEVLTANLSAAVWQIDDVVLHLHTTVEETMKQFQSSTAGWQLDYNPDKLVIANEDGYIEVFASDGTRLLVYYKNFLDETVSLKDCIYIYLDCDELENDVRYMPLGYSNDGNTRYEDVINYLVENEAYKRRSGDDIEIQGKLSYLEESLRDGIYITISYPMQQLSFEQKGRVITSDNESLLEQNLNLVMYRLIFNTDTGVCETLYSYRYNRNYRVTIE